MLYTITDLSDPLVLLVRDDPVRPEIALSARINAFAHVYVWRDSQSFEPLAVTCSAFRVGVPQSVEELSRVPDSLPDTAVFYTIWSYRRGAAGQLIRSACWAIKRQYSHIEQFVTLSPTTEMARQFHLANGASVFRENRDSVNYLYSVPDLGAVSADQEL